MDTDSYAFVHSCTWGIVHHTAKESVMVAFNGKGPYRLMKNKIDGDDVIEPCPKPPMKDDDGDDNFPPIVDAITFLPDGMSVLIASRGMSGKGGSLRMLDVGKEKISILSLDADLDTTRSGSESSDDESEGGLIKGVEDMTSIAGSTRVACYVESGEVVIFDFEENKILCRLSTPSTTCTGVQRLFSWNPGRLFSVHNDECCMVDFEKCKVEPFFSDGLKDGSSISGNEELSILYLGECDVDRSDGKILLVDVRTSKVEMRLTDEGEICGISILGNHTNVVSGDKNGRMLFWDIRKAKEPSMDKIQAHKTGWYVNRLMRGFGNNIVSCSNDESVHVRNWNGKLLKSFDASCSCYAISYHCPSEYKNVKAMQEERLYEQERIEYVLDGIVDEKEDEKWYFQVVIGKDGKTFVGWKSFFFSTK